MYVRRRRAAVGDGERIARCFDDARLVQIPQFDAGDRRRSRDRAVDPRQTLTAISDRSDPHVRGVLVADHENQEALAARTDRMGESGRP